MRVISGSARGRRLWAPRGHEIRPATDRLKESLFNILFSVDEETVLDLYAGTGSLAIEALSRGAAHAVLVERTPVAMEAIRRNLEACGLTDRATVIEADVRTGLRREPCRRRAPFHLVFCDPPYSVGEEELAQVAALLAEDGLLDPSARLAFERQTGQAAPPLPPGWTWTRTRAFGQTTLHVAEAEV